MSGLIFWRTFDVGVNGYPVRLIVRFTDLKSTTSLTCPSGFSMNLALAHDSVGVLQTDIMPAANSSSMYFFPLSAMLMSIGLAVM